MAVPDVQGEGEEGSGGAASVPSTPTGVMPHQQHPPVFVRSQSEASALSVPVASVGTSTGGSSMTGARRAPAVGGTGRPRGRPRKNPVVTFQNPVSSRLTSSPL